MQLGFVTALFGDLSLDEVFAFAADEGFACVELMCWPPGKADRRYAGVTHVDVTRLDEQADHVRELVKRSGVSISGLGYYPNPLDPEEAHRRVVIEHLKRVITAAARLGVGVVNTFIGRDLTKSVEDNWPLFRAVWPDVVRHAEVSGVRIGLENCPMLFTRDEWPGGKNLAISPAVWRTIFQEIPSGYLGLNLDPSHLVWLHIDEARCVREFGPRIVHVHAKDTRIDRANASVNSLIDTTPNERLLDRAWSYVTLGYGHDLLWWREFCSILRLVGYDDVLSIEHEDQALPPLEGVRRSVDLLRDVI